MAIQDDLKLQYESFVQKFRNVSYLEELLEDFHRTEQDKFEETEESMKRMQVLRAHSSYVLSAYPS